MTTPDHPTVALSIRLRLLAAWAATAWERLWVRLWLPASVLGFAAAVALTDILPALPGAAHLAVVLGALGGLGWLTYRRLAGFQWPSWQAARTRLEQSAAATHRPLTAIQDAPAGAQNASPAHQALWQAHQERARASIAALRASWPAPGIAARDPHTIRAMAVIALFVAVMGGWGDIGARLMRAAWPSWDDASAGPNVKVWITPPAYTGRSPVFVESPAAAGAAQPATLEAPEHSKILVVVTGTKRPTSVAVGDTTLKLEKLADDSQRLEQELPNGNRLEVNQRGRVLGSWGIADVPDLPPSIAFVSPPHEAGRWRLMLDYRASDDYGVVNVRAHVTRPPQGAGTATDTDAFDFDVAAPPFSPRDVTQTSLHDLTEHPWAGQRVQIQLIATDHADQSAVSDFQDVVLPERVFQHPVARDLIAIRKGLLSDPMRTARAALVKLSAILQSPQSFGGDPRVFLELSAAKYRLAYRGALESAQTLPPILWAAAVRIEDGNLAVAERRLDEAEKALSDAMQRGAPAAEIARLLDELQRAIGEYARELASRLPTGDMNLLNPGGNARTVGPDDIARMMQELRQMTQMGAQDAARNKLAELQNMLQALRAAAGGVNESPEVRQAQEIMRDLKALTAEQAKLLDETFKQLREAQLKGSPSGEGKQDQVQRQRAAERQEKLRMQLGELMGRMAEAAGEVPQSMAEAEKEMRAARDALKAGALKPAADAEGQALAKLQNGLQEANDGLMQALAEKGLSGLVAMPGGLGGGDPLGQGNGPEDNIQVDIPDTPDANAMAQRVRAILEEIRRRAADRTRPDDEQDYLRRLMKQF